MIYKFQPTLPARGATWSAFSDWKPKAFQPTLPARGATHHGRNRHPRRDISTHAPRTGSDKSGQLPAELKKDFNPRSPHGERPSRSGLPIGWHLNFNPRSPHGERLSTPEGVAPLEKFQPTLPARGATETKADEWLESGFQPTLPARGATHTRARQHPYPAISTHAPRTGSDR